MRKFRLGFLALLMVFAINGVVFGWGSTGGDGSRYTQLQEVAVFFNNSGGTLSAGDVVVLDTDVHTAASSTVLKVASGSTLGAYVTTTTSADNVLAIGVVKSVSSATLTPVAVVTRGPVGAHCANSSGTNVTAGTAVGTYTDARQCDSGDSLGVGIAGGDNTDFEASEGTQTLTWIWVQGIGTE